MRVLVFLINFFMLAFFLAGCSWESKSYCRKNCAVDNVLMYEKSSFIFELNQTVQANGPLWKLDDPIDSCTIKPSLPTGLKLKSDCSIVGAPTVSAPMQIYTVTARAKNNTVVTKISLATSLDGVVPEEHGNFNFVVNSAINQKLSLSSNVPRNCRIQPKLPLGLSLTDSCQLVGTPMVSSQLKNYTVFSLTDNLDKEEIYKITVVGADDPDLIFMVDARRADGTNPVNTSVVTYPSNEQAITDLSAQKHPTVFDLYNLTSNIGLGTGTPSDPYRFDFWAGRLEVTNPHNLKFNETSGTILTYFHFPDFYLSADFTMGIPNFWYFSNSRFNSTANPHFFSYDGWHQFGYVFDRTSDKTYTYMDGELKKTQDGVPPNSSLISNLNYRAEFGHVAMYKRAFSAAEMATSCKSFQGVYSGLPCASESRALELQPASSNYPMVTYCSPVAWRLENSTGGLKSFGVDLKFDLSGPNVKYFSDQNCTSQITTVTVPAGIDQGTIYFKPENSGSFLQIVQPQKTSMAATQTSQSYFGVPTSLSYEAQMGCLGDPNYILIAARDNNNFLTYLKTPITINIFDGTTTTQVSFAPAQPVAISYPALSNTTYTFSVVGGTYNGGTVTVGSQLPCPGGD